jgi:hypothetical protein
MHVKAERDIGARTPQRSRSDHKELNTFGCCTHDHQLPEKATSQIGDPATTLAIRGLSPSIDEIQRSEEGRRAHQRARRF